MGGDPARRPTIPSDASGTQGDPRPSGPSSDVLGGTERDEGRPDAGSNPPDPDLQRPNAPATREIPDLRPRVLDEPPTVPPPEGSRDAVPLDPPPSDDPAMIRRREDLRPRDRIGREPATDRDHRRAGTDARIHTHPRASTGHAPPPDGRRRRSRRSTNPVGSGSTSTGVGIRDPGSIGRSGIFGYRPIPPSVAQSPWHG